MEEALKSFFYVNPRETVLVSLFLLGRVRPYDQPFVCSVDGANGDMGKLHYMLHDSQLPCIDEVPSEVINLNSPV